MLALLRILILLFSLLISFSSVGQHPGISDYLPPRSPPAPTTAALEKYALMPVNEAYGTPEITLPLYEIRSGSLALPLSLSYHASGIHVAEMASWAGLGWSLNAGGVVTRVVRGLADDGYGAQIGFSDTYDQVPPSLRVIDPDVATDYSFLEEISSGRKDYQPDLYTYNFNGQSGCFMMGNDGKFHSIPSKPLSIELINHSIRILDEHGTQFFFGSTGTSRESTVTTPRAKRDSVAWYLDQIISSDKQDTIRLSYHRTLVHHESLQQTYRIPTSVGATAPGSGSPSSIPTTTYQETRQSTDNRTPKLETITFAGGRVTLEAIGDRLDGHTDERLQAIRVYAKGNITPQKEFLFHHSYFNAAQVGDRYANDLLRLKLDSVVELGGALHKPAFVFSYDNTSLPHRQWGGRDHWGYYNGKPSVSPPSGNSGNPCFIPSTAVTSFQGTVQIFGANREPDLSFVGAGMLTGIKYPTGGFQQFTYEPNTIPEQYQVPHPFTTVAVDTFSATGNGRVRAVRTFTVLGPVSQASITILLQGNPDAVGQAHGPAGGSVLFRDLTMPGQSYANSNAASLPAIHTTIANIQLEENHTYEISASATEDYTASISVSYLLTADIQYAWRNKISGGLRLKESRIKADSHAAIHIRHYDYASPITHITSGYLVSSEVPVYQRDEVVQSCERDANDTGGGPGSIWATWYKVLSSSSLGEFEGADQPVAYGWVTVTDSSTTGLHTGKTVSQYSIGYDQVSQRKPFPPKILNSWKRGNLLRQERYALDEQGGPARLVHLTVNQYVSVDTVEINGFIVGPGAAGGRCGGFPSSAFFPPFFFEHTLQISGWHYLQKTQEYRYAAANSTSLATATTYTYGNPKHCQPTVIESTLEGGRRQQTRYRYMADYDTTTSSNAAEAVAIREALRSHNVAQAIEQTSLVLTPTDTLVTAGSVLLPHRLSPGVVGISRQLLYRTSAPQALRTYVPSKLQSGILRLDSHYQPQVMVDKYDGHANVLQFRQYRGTPSSTIWGYDSRIAIADITQDSVASCAFTSFEPGSAGTWVYTESARQAGGRTGQWAYNLSGSAAVNRGGLPTGEYELLFWAQQRPVITLSGSIRSEQVVASMTPPGSAVWQQYRLRLQLSHNSSINFSAPAGGTLLDEVRLHHVGGQMVSYTFDPLVGMTSRTDVTGRTITYEYDGLGRLIGSRDEQGRIIGLQQYQYARP